MEAISYLDRVLGIKGWRMPLSRVAIGLPGWLHFPLSNSDTEVPREYDRNNTRVFKVGKVREVLCLWVGSRSS
jgi:hypothetical protein